MPRYVEDRHRALLARRVVDVRPFGTRYAEWLSQPLNFIMVAVAHLVIMALSVIFIPVAGISLLIHTAMHVSTKTLLPFRYPVFDPSSTPSKKVKADGIFLMGSVESDSEYEAFKEVWLADDDLRKHMLILGSTGSGKSETLKGIFFNALCWSSGFFVADGKADNKLPTDTFTMARSFGRDDDLLVLNFLLGGRTPEQVRKSRRRRTNKLNPVSSADADTIIQMGANMLPKVEGEGKNWQEKALNLWRAVIVALCYKRDNENFDISVSTIIDYLALPKVEELFIQGYEEAQQRGEWSYGFAGIKAYLETGCPAYKVDKLLGKHGYGDAPAPPPGRPGANSGKQFEQDSMAYEQHSYRTNQLMPVLNLLDKTYGYIFRDKYSEIDMIDVTLNNRIMAMLIPSLEKSASEAENLGKLAIACLRVMMGKNLGSEVEGTRNELLSSKATNANYPYPVALDELAYYFSDGIAVMFAQARSLGFCMIAAAQDLEKLTEGSRQAEAGAMLANSVAKYFMRIDDANKTYEFIKKILGQITVAVRQSFELGQVAYRRTQDVVVQEVDRVSLEELKGKKAGEGVFDSAGQTVRVKSFYVGKDLEQNKCDDFWVLRFLQVEPPSDLDIDAHSTPIDQVDNAGARGQRMLGILRQQISRSNQPPLPHPVISAMAHAATNMNDFTPAGERGIALYMAAKQALHELETQHHGAIDGAAAQYPGGDAVDDGHNQQHGHAVGGVSQYTADRSPATGLSAAARTSSPSSAEQDFDDALGLDELPSQLDFLNTVPFERKPADVLLSDGSSSSFDQSMMASGRRVSDEAWLQDSPASAGSTIIDQFFSRGRTLSIARTAGLQPGQPRPHPAETSLTGPTPGTLVALAGQIEPERVRTVDDAISWMERASTGVDQTLLQRKSSGQSVVGFVPETSKSVAKIEEVLGSADPHKAAKQVERIVSAKITPDFSRQDKPLDTGAVDDFFSMLEPNDP